MNLSDYTKRELDAKIEKVKDVSMDLSIIKVNLQKQYEKLLNKRRVNPDQFLEALSKFESVCESMSLLTEYKNIIGAEISRKENVSTVDEENEITNERYRNSVMQEFELIYDEYIISEGSEIAKRNYPASKLMAVKEFKELSGAGLKESKDFADFCWKELQSAYNISPRG
jgi:ribosomal protein L7/L12